MKAFVTYVRLMLEYNTINSSDGRVVRVSASVAVDLGSIPSRIKPMILIGIHSFPA